MQNEGYRRHAYTDTTGHLTIGYGFNCEVLRLDCTEPMSKKDARRLFADVYAVARLKARLYAGPAWDRLEQRKKDVLADLAYNLGSGGLWEFVRMRAAILRGDDAAAMEELKNSKWWHQVKSRGPRLVDHWNG